MEATETAVQIQHTVAQSFRISYEDLVGRKRHRRYSYPRMLAMYLIYELTDLTLTQTAELFGGVHHAAIIHARRWADDNVQYAEYIREMTGRFSNAVDR